MDPSITFTCSFWEEGFQGKEFLEFFPEFLPHGGKAPASPLGAWWEIPQELPLGSGLGPTCCWTQAHCPIFLIPAHRNSHFPCPFFKHTG